MSGVQLQINPEAIESVLEEIVESDVFRTSKQCQALLRYIVEHSIAGEEDLLRERVIGNVVFSRNPAYDTANDPVVRSRVGEVRKRLAQFYQKQGDKSDIRITIPSGSYRAIFTHQESAAHTHLQETQSAEHAKTFSIPNSELLENSLVKPTPDRRAWSGKTTWLTGSALMLILAAAIASWFLPRSGSKHVDEQLFAKFWSPIVSSGKPAVIYIGGNYTYRLSTPFLQAYQTRLHRPYNGPEFFIDLRDGESIPEKDIIPTNSLIGFGDVAASSRIVSTLTRLGAQYDLRYGQDIAVTEMRKSPIILIGGFSNAWAMQLTSHLRFTLEGGNRVIDHQNPNRAWPNLDGTPDNPLSDYVVISRLAQSPTGGFTLVVSGVGTVGNQAAADFISDPASVAKLLRNAPSGWEHMNFQAVLRANEMKEIPTSTEIIAVYFS